MSSIHLYNNHHLGIQYVFKSVSLKGSARICVKSLISSNIIHHLGSSWCLSISSWSTTVTVSSTSWRFMRGAWPLGHWWAATVGATRPPAMCPPPTVSTSTSGQTTLSAGQASGSDTRQVSGKTKYSLDLPNAWLVFSACGGEYSSPSGIIRSPYHPANYPQHRSCVYRVSAPRGHVIQIQFRCVRKGQLFLLCPFRLFMKSSFVIYGIWIYEH